MPYQDLERFCSERKLNILFYKSFQRYILRKKPVLFLLAGNDPGTEIFQHYFVEQYFEKNCQDILYDDLVKFSIIENANHVYTLQECQESLLKNVCGWINTKKHNVSQNCDIRIVNG